MKVINYSKVRENLKSVLDRVAEDADYTVITRKNSDDAVVMSLDTFNSYIETIYLMKSPKNAKWLAESIDQLEINNTVKKDLIDK